MLFIGNTQDHIHIKLYKRPLRRQFLKQCQFRCILPPPLPPPPFSFFCCWFCPPPPPLPPPTSLPSYSSSYNIMTESRLKTNTIFVCLFVCLFFCNHKKGGVIKREGEGGRKGQVKKCEWAGENRKQVDVFACHILVTSRPYRPFTWRVWVALGVETHFFGHVNRSERTNSLTPPLTSRLRGGGRQSPQVDGSKQPQAICRYVHGRPRATSSIAEHSMSLVTCTAVKSPLTQLELRGYCDNSHHHPRRAHTYTLTIAEQLLPGPSTSTTQTSIHIQAAVTSSSRR